VSRRPSRVGSSPVQRKRTRTAGLGLLARWADWQDRVGWGADVQQGLNHASMWRLHQSLNERPWPCSLGKSTGRTVVREVFCLDLPESRSPTLNSYIVYVCGAVIWSIMTSDMPSDTMFPDIYNHRILIWRKYSHVRRLRRRTRTGQPILNCAVQPSSSIFHADGQVEDSPMM